MQVRLNRKNQIIHPYAETIIQTKNITTRKKNES
jgi:hypothetical protein